MTDRQGMRQDRELYHRRFFRIAQSKTPSSMHTNPPLVKQRNSGCLNNLSYFYSFISNGQEKLNIDDHCENYFELISRIRHHVCENLSINCAFRERSRTHNFPPSLVFPSVKNEAIKLFAFGRFLFIVVEIRIAIFSGFLGFIRISGLFTLYVVHLL